MKSCTKCQRELDPSLFYKKAAARDGLSPDCKECIKRARAEHYKANKGALAEKNRRHYEANRESRKSSQRDWYRSNKDAACSYQKAYRGDNAEKISSRAAEYRRKNKDAIRSTMRVWYQNKYRSDPSFNLTKRARAQAAQAFRGAHNSPGFFRHMPYTKEEFVDHLKSTLPKGYTEADICDGSKLHIDHIRPVSSFNLTGDVDEEFLACWALDNLQLLPAAENLSKSDSMDWNAEKETI